MALTGFRLREAEEKMRDAARLEDFEAAIEWRDKVRTLRAEVDDPEVVEKVVTHLFSKTAYVVPETEDLPVGDDETPIDKGAIAMLKAALTEYESGERYGVVLLSGINDDGGMRDVFTEASSAVNDFTTLFIGALELAKVDITEGLWLGEVSDEFEGEEHD
jgi:hypothetical protein